MLTNQNLLRYVSYLGDYNPVDSRLPDIESQDVKSNNLVLTKFNELILDETQVTLFFNPLNSMFTGQATSNDVYTLDIIIPYKYWLINNTSELRAYSIAYEVGQSIDQKNIAGIGNVEIMNWESYKVNDRFSGVTLFIKVTNSSLSEG